MDLHSQDLLKMGKICKVMLFRILGILMLVPERQITEASGPWLTELLPEEGNAGNTWERPWVDEEELWTQKTCTAWDSSESSISREDKGLRIPMDPPPSVIRELIHTKSETLARSREHFSGVRSNCIQGTQRGSPASLRAPQLTEQSSLQKDRSSIFSWA